MLDELKAIDTSAIEELQRIKGEQEVLSDRLAKMEEKKGKVSEEVFMRVRQDYETRMHALEQEAAPLKEAARAEYTRLKKLLDEIGDAARTAQLDREELELRHELGEFSEEEYEELVKDHESRIGEHEARLSEAEELRQRFHSAFLAPEELELPVTEEPGTGTEEVPPPAMELDDDESTGEETEAETQDLTPPGAGGEPPVPLEVSPAEAGSTAGEEDPFVPAGEAAPAVETAEEGSQQEAAPEGGAFADATEAIPVTPEATGGEDGETGAFAAGATMLITWPKLIGQAEDGSTVEYPVAGATTSLGRDPDNDIVLSGKKVSRHHAEVVLAEDGYMIRDLGSTVGTLVNGVQVDEWKLSNGDSVQLGDVVLVFMET